MGQANEACSSTDECCQQSGGAPREKQANAVPCSQHVSEEEEQIFGIGTEMHFCISLWKCMQ